MKDSTCKMINKTSSFKTKCIGTNAEGSRVNRNTLSHVLDSRLPVTSNYFGHSGQTSWHPLSLEPLICNAEVNGIYPECNVEQSSTSLSEPGVPHNKPSPPCTQTTH